MNKKQSTILAMSVLLISSLLVQVYTANAQVFNVVTDLEQVVMGISYQSVNDSFWVVTGGNSSGQVWLYQIDRSTRTLILSVNQTAQFNDLSAGVPQDIWCGNTSCYVTTTGGGVYAISTEDIAPNIFAGYNVTGSYQHTSGLGHITGRDQVSGGFGTVTLWIDTITGTNRNVIIVDGISFLLAGTLPAYGVSAVDERVHDIRWSGVEGITDNDLITSTGYITDTAAQNSLVVYNLASLSIKCNVALPSTNLPLAVAPNYIAAGSSDNKIYVGSINGIVYVYNENTCAVVQTVTTGLGGDIRFLDYSAGRLFLQESGANAYIMQFATNSTGHILSTNVTYSPLPTAAQNNFDATYTTLSKTKMVNLAGNGQVWYPYTGADNRIGILIFNEATGGGSGGSGGNQVDGRCGVGTALDCVGDRSLINQVTGGTSWGTLGNSLFGGIGLVNTTASNDIRENGTGLLLMLMLGAFFSSITIGSISVANNKFGAGISYTEIPKEFWLFLVVGVVSVSYYLQWIPDIVFYSMIVGLAGLFSFGLYKHIRGG